MAEPAVFARRMLDRARAVPVEAARILAGTANAAGRNVVRATPVDTGLARSNWVAALNSPDLSDRAIRSRSATISEIKSVTAGVKMDGEIHIANGGDKVPYLKFLNDGSSRQAPAGFVGFALVMAKDFLQNARILVMRRTRQ